MSQEHIQKELQSLKEVVENRTVDRWHTSDMHNWVQQVNRELEHWNAATERALGFEEGTLQTPYFPDPFQIHSNPKKK